MEITVEASGVESAMQDLTRLQGQSSRAVGRALTRCGLLAQREAKANAPRGPTSAQLKALRTTKRKTRKKARAYSRPSPGGLERSIDMVVTGDDSRIAFAGRDAQIYVSANSPAGKYAFRLHEEREKTWWWRGPGTVAKGGRAREKFIERAVIENADEFGRIFESEIENLGLTTAPEEHS